MASDESTEQPRMSVAERVAVGGAVAPIIRQRAGAGRRVTVVDREGKPVRVTDDVEIAKGLLARADIEFSVQPGKRPKFVACQACGRPLRVGRTGPLPLHCKSGAHKCTCGKPIVTNACGAGKRCRRCRGTEQIRRYANGNNRRRVTDDQVREVVASAATLHAAAECVGLTPSALARRARRLGVVPGGEVQTTARRAAEIASTSRRAEVLRVFREHGSLAAAARALGISKQSVRHHVQCAAALGDR